MGWLTSHYICELGYITYVVTLMECYGVASARRIDQMIGLFCKRALLQRQV